MKLCLTLKKEDSESIYEDPMCTACLCARTTHKLDDDTLQYYMKILIDAQLISTTSPAPSVCWECQSVLRRWGRFREQVTQSFATLNSAQPSRDQKGIKNLVSKLSRPGRLECSFAFSINIVPGNNIDGWTVIIGCIDDDDSKVMTACNDDGDSKVITASDDVHDDYGETLLPVKEEDECGTENPDELIANNMQTTVFVEPFETVDDGVETSFKTSFKTSSKTTHDDESGPLPSKECVLLCSEQQCKRCPIGIKLSSVDNADKGVKCDKLRSLKSDLDLPKKPVKKCLKCNMCHERFTIKEKMRIHKRENHGQCDFCSLKSLSSGSRLVHMKRMHPDIRYECDMCQKRFMFKFQLRAHISDLHKKFCVLCSTYKTFKSNKMLNDHLGTHPGELFQCDKCHKKYNSKRDMRRHMKKSHSGKSVLCEVCSKAFTYTYDYQKHMRKHHGERCNVPENLRHQCHLCSRKFAKIESLNAHVETHVHRNRNSLKCELCNITFQSEKRYLQHKRKHTGETLKYMENVCPMCKKSFPKKYFMKLHMLSHTQERNWTCEVCLKRFLLKTTLMAHILRLHSNATPFQCEKCSKAFKFKIDLDRHVLTHDNVKMYQCNECQKTFSTRGYLRIHMVTHSDRRPFQCEVCLKFFKRNHTLKKHKLLHAQVVQKPYQCGVCNITFITNNHLKRHQVVHTRARPFQCNVCSNTYARKDYLLVHMRSHTGNTAHSATPLN